MNARLQVLVIQRQRRGMAPPPRITAPLAELRRYTMQHDDNRAAYLDQSARTVAGQVAPLRREVAQ